MTTPTAPLHHALLRPAILHILRAAGFHSTRPSVLDTLTDLAARYFLLLAQRMALFASETQDEVLDAAQDAGSSMKELEELYGEGLRRVLAGAAEDQTDATEENDETTIKATSTTPAPSTEESKPSAEILQTPQAADQPPTTNSAPKTTNITHLPHTIPGPHTPQTPTPTLPHILQSLTTTHVFPTTHTPSEIHWATHLRRPLHSFPAGTAREKERKRRDEDDTRDVREFVEWCSGGVAGECRRVAGLELKEEEELVPLPNSASGTKRGAGDMTGGGVVAGDSAEGGAAKKVKVRPDDYIALLKKKYSRIGDGARYQGTVLGRQGVDGVEEGGGGGGHGRVRIEGGPAESLRGWREVVRRRGGGDGSGDVGEGLERKGSRRGAAGDGSSMGHEEVARRQSAVEAG